MNSAKLRTRRSMRVSPLSLVAMIRNDRIAVIDYYDNIQDRRVVSNVAPGYLQKILPSGPPEQGEKWEDIQKDIESKIMPGLTHWYDWR